MRHFLVFVCGRVLTLWGGLRSVREGGDAIFACLTDTVLDMGHKTLLSMDNPGVSEDKKHTHKNNKFHNKNSR